MQELLQAVKEAATAETCRAGRIHGDFASVHEAYGVLAEEVQEFNEESIQLADDNLAQLLRAIRAGNVGSIDRYVDDMADIAARAAAEAIQVLAVCRRFQNCLNVVEPLHEYRIVKDLLDD